MATEIITKDDLEQFKQELLAQIKLMSTTRKTLRDEWLKSSDLKKELPLSPGTMQTLRINGTVAYSRLGTTIFYSVDSIRHALKKGLIDNSQLRKDSKLREAL